MTKKKQKTSASGVYALCITIGLIIGLGMGPLLGNLPVMVLAGGVIGAAIAYLLVRKARTAQHKHPHSH